MGTFSKLNFSNLEQPTTVATVRSTCEEALTHSSGAVYGRDTTANLAIAHAYTAVYGTVASELRRSLRSRNTGLCNLDYVRDTFARDDIASMQPNRWMQQTGMEAELQRLVEADGNNDNVRVVKAYDPTPNSPLHQLELMNTHPNRGVHWILLLHSRQQEGPAKHFCLDPLDKGLWTAAAKKYDRATHVWSNHPMQELFNVQRRFAPLQDNNYDCGPGVCLLASAVIQQLGTGISADMPTYLRTPLSQVRMEMAVHAFVRTTNPCIITKRTKPKPTKPDPTEQNPDTIVISSDCDTD